MDKSYLNLGVRGRLFDLILPISGGKESGKGTGELSVGRFSFAQSKGKSDSTFYGKEKGGSSVQILIRSGL